MRQGLKDGAEARDDLESTMYVHFEMDWTLADM